MGTSPRWAVVVGTATFKAASTATSDDAGARFRKFLLANKEATLNEDGLLWTEVAGKLAAFWSSGEVPSDLLVALNRRKTKNKKTPVAKTVGEALGVG
jgi:hypothetical protein